MAKVATSAEEAKDLMYLAASDSVTLNRRHVLMAAKAASGDWSTAKTVVKLAPL
jgi:hypothetical protein